LADSTIGLFKTEVIDFMGPWKSVGRIEWETLNWVSWYNTKRLHSKSGYITPQEAEETFYETLNAEEKAAKHLNQAISGKPGAVHLDILEAIPQ
jgi:hypothetical protein